MNDRLQLDIEAAAERRAALSSHQLQADLRDLTILAALGGDEAEADRRACILLLMARGETPQFKLDGSPAGEKLWK